jgi:hypothetical protein
MTNKKIVYIDCKCPDCNLAFKLSEDYLDLDYLEKDKDNFAVVFYPKCLKEKFKCGAWNPTISYNV